jgi:hypothetical protein
MYSEPIQQKLMVTTEKAVSTHVRIRHILTKQASVFENINAGLCQPQRILRTTATTPEFTSRHFYQAFFFEIIYAPSDCLLAFLENCSKLGYCQHPVFSHALKGPAIVFS